jgi:hypothetical protein
MSTSELLADMLLYLIGAFGLGFVSGYLITVFKQAVEKIG